ncbi:hypothetical protein [Vibrio quintilis]|uniref:DinB family protein n=1 Tax=Vibrio quintilis TaxID=1117707 RepID=A0A1M7YWK2_9VIBR|nr:hypothetical protein [Vibrio quintilis]SHO56893.1 hypothetical protein VQ7734_02662 [Vibrio quintilis]
MTSHTYDIRDTESLPLQPCIRGCLETLEQGHRFLQSIDDHQYTCSAPPHLSSSIGEHFRHLLDLFHAVRQPTGVIDYNTRRRGHAVERTRHIAISEVEQLRDWLKQLNHANLTLPVRVRTEVSLSQQEACDMMSTIERELTFVALHATHHYALARVAVSLNHIEVSDNFGFAPATVSYLREKN